MFFKNFSLSKFFSKKINFLKLSDDTQYKSSQIWTRSLIWAITASSGFGLIYSFVARIDEVVIARGELQPLGAKRPIKAPYSGRISHIYVNEGDSVKAGQILLRFDTKILGEKKAGLESKLMSLNNSLNINLDILDRFKKLFEDGAISRIELLNQMDLVQQIESEITQQNSKINEINIQLNQADLSSPLDGKVFNLVPYSTGYKSDNGETLLEVVPLGILEAKVFLTNTDIGFVKINMPAEIRVDAFPFTQFGSISGVLKSIGDEVLAPDQLNPQPRYPVYVSLNQQYLEKNNKNLNLRSGNSVSVNFIVREKPVISLLSDSLEKAIDSLRSIKSDNN